MLRTRVITAVILAAGLLAAMYWLPRPGWVLLTFVLTLVALWEWTRIAPLAGSMSKVFLGASFLVGVALLSCFLANDNAVRFRFGEEAVAVGLWAASIFWILIVPLWLVARWRPRNPLLLAAAGWLVIFPTWFALIVLRPQEGQPWQLLGLMVLVWVADIAAYFAGRAFGKRKLAPSISPGKTWEGVAGAATGVVLYAALWIGIAKTTGVGIWPGLVMTGPFVFLAFLALMALSILGDLFESWMKRGAGLKDSSNLLPGHGGVLDRIDALTSTLPTAPFVFFAVQWLFKP